MSHLCQCCYVLNVFILKRPLWKWWKVSIKYSWNALFKSCISLSSSSCRSARHILVLVLYTQSLPSPLTLCVWPAVPFMLIKTTNAPTLPPAPIAHTPLPSTLITEASVLLIGVISSSEQPPPPHLLLHSHLWEVCRGDRGHRLWRADIHRVPQRCHKEVRKGTRETSSSIQLHATSPLL